MPVFVRFQSRKQSLPDFSCTVLIASVVLECCVMTVCTAEKWCGKLDCTTLYAIQLMITDCNTKIGVVYLGYKPYHPVRLKSLKVFISHAHVHVHTYKRTHVLP